MLIQSYKQLFYGYYLGNKQIFYDEFAEKYIKL